VFERDWQDSDGAYAVVHPGVAIAASEAAKMRPNVSFIAWARQYGVDVAPELDAMPIVTNLSMFGRMNPEEPLNAAADAFHAAPELRQRMNDLLLQLDLGLAGIDLREMTRLCSSLVRSPARPATSNSSASRQAIAGARQIVAMRSRACEAPTISTRSTWPAHLARFLNFDGRAQDLQAKRFGGPFSWSAMELRRRRPCSI
jgi:hypothetical protein